MSNSDALTEEILDQLKEIRAEQRAQRVDYGGALARLDERLKGLEAIPPGSIAPPKRHTRRDMVASGTSAAIVVGIVEGLKAVLSK